MTLEQCLEKRLGCVRSTALSGARPVLCRQRACQEHTHPEKGLLASSVRGREGLAVQVRDKHSLHQQSAHEIPTMHVYIVDEYTQGEDM